MDKELISRYLISQTSLRDYLSYSQFVSLFPSPYKSNISVKSQKKLRQIYHALISEDHDRELTLTENLDEFVAIMNQVERDMEEEDAEKVENAKNRANITEYLDISSAVDATLLDELAEDLAVILEIKAKDLDTSADANFARMEKIVDSLNDLRYGGSAQEVEVVAQTTKEVNALNELINNEMR